MPKHKNLNNFCHKVRNVTHGLCYNSHRDTRNRHKGAKHSRRFLYSSAPLFIYLCSSLLHPHVYTCTYTPALMYAPVDFTYQRPARGMLPDQRHDRLNLALANYTLDTVPRCPSPPRCRFLILFLLFSPLYPSHTRIRTIGRTGGARAFTNCAHNSRTCGHLCVRYVLECAAFSFARI